jgi:hypothetical protein
MKFPFRDFWSRLIVKYWRLHLQTWSGKLLLELMITKGNKQKRQSRIDPAFALWQLNIDSGMVNYTLLMTLIEARKSDGK